MDYIKIKLEHSGNFSEIVDDVDQTVYLGTRFSDGIKITEEDLASLDIVESIVQEEVRNALEEYECKDCGDNEEFYEETQRILKELGRAKEQIKELRQENRKLKFKLKKMNKNV